MPWLWWSTWWVCTSIWCIYLNTRDNQRLHINNRMLAIVNNWTNAAFSNYLFQTINHSRWKITAKDNTGIIQNELKYFLHFLFSSASIKITTKSTVSRHTSTSGRCSISSTFCTSPLAAAFTSSSFRSPETCVSNNFFSSALNRSVVQHSKKCMAYECNQNGPNILEISISKWHICKCNINFRLHKAADGWFHTSHESTRHLWYQWNTYSL